MTIIVIIVIVIMGNGQQRLSTSNAQSQLPQGDFQSEC